MISLRVNSRAVWTRASCSSERRRSMAPRTLLLIRDAVDALGRAARRLRELPALHRLEDAARDFRILDARRELALHDHAAAIDLERDRDVAVKLGAALALAEVASMIGGNR